VNWPPAAPPLTAGPFIGRDAELAAVRDELESAGGDPAPLVTLLGPAGSGKTRLANEVALAELDRRDGRVAWVALGAMTDAALVPSAIADALGVPEAPGDEILAAIARELVAGDPGTGATRPPLLVLDALAQLVPEVGFVDQLRRLAPGLAILVTSRRPLRLDDERTVDVAPLAVPDDGADAAAVGASPAVRLLLAHASAQPGSRAEPPAVTPANASTFALLVRRLDGLPLALEIGGAALRRVTPRQLLDRLATPHEGQASAVLDTLGATLDRSAELVSGPAQVVFRRLAVLVGPLDLGLAQAIVDRGVMLGLEEPGIDVAAAVDELVEASLLRRLAPTPTTPAIMLETVRAHARRRLEATAELMTAEWAHAHEIVERVEALESRISPTVDEEALATLDRLAPETAAALDRAAARGGEEVLLRLSGALAEWWRMRGRLTEGRLRLELALRRTPGRRDAARARALFGAASLSYRQGDFSHARGLLDEAIRLWVELGDRTREARARNTLGLVAFDEGRMPEALDHAEAGLAIRRELGDRSEIASSLNTVGGIRHFRGELEAAGDALRECLAIRQDLGDAGGAAVCLANLALVDRDLGELDRAVERLEAALATRRRLGDRLREAVTLHNLGLVRLEQGRLPEAHSAIETALGLARELGDRVEVGDALADLSHIARDEGRIGEAWRLATEAVRLASRMGARGVLALALEASAALAGGEDPVDGARLWAAAGALRARTGYALLHADRRRLLREVDSAQSRADPEVWAQAWAEGEALDEEAAAALALERAGETAAA
jgi:predicted ATPase